MKKTTEIVYGRTGKVNIGNYNMDSPFYSAKTIIELNGEEVDKKSEFEELRSIIDPLYENHVKEIKGDTSHLHIRDVNGKKWVSVTSVMYPDKLDIDPDYGIRGTEIHRIFYPFTITGQWEDPKAELKALTYDQIPYKQFFEKFGDRIEFGPETVEYEVQNTDYLYYGKPDGLCTVDGITTLFDVKTGQWNWMQLLAYWRCNTEIKQLAIFDFKKTKLILLDPRSKDGYVHFEKFLIKLGAFRQRYF